MSGWTYARWRGDFYPERLPQRRELAYVAQHLDAVEVNGTFYRLQHPAHFARWVEETPEHFRFALKGSRYITHLKALHDVRRPLANFLASGPLLLGPRLGPLLWQLAERTRFDAVVLEDFLRLLPADFGSAAELAAEHDERFSGRTWFDTDTPAALLRHVLEPRHPSFDCYEARSLLAHYGVGLVVSDSAGVFPTFEPDPSDLVYVRLHGPQRLYAGGYSDSELDGWADRVKQWSDDGTDVWVFFDNDIDGRAPYDALGLRSRLRVTVDASA